MMDSHERIKNVCPPLTKRKPHSLQCVISKQVSYNMAHNDTNIVLDERDVSSFDPDAFDRLCDEIYCLLFNFLQYRKHDREEFMNCAFPVLMYQKRLTKAEIEQFPLEWEYICSILDGVKEGTRKPFRQYVSVFLSKNKHKKTRILDGWIYL